MILALYSLLRSLWQYPNAMNLTPSPSSENLQTSLSLPSIVVASVAATATSTVAATAVDTEVMQNRTAQRRIASR